METASLSLQVGDIRVAFRCQDEGLRKSLVEKYCSFLSSAPPDFRLDFDLRRELSATEINDLLPRLQPLWKDGSVLTEPRLFECRMDWVAGRGLVSTERELFSPKVTYRFWNDIVRGVYYGVHKLIKGTSPPAHFVHGCGIIGHAGGYLFTGPPGAGKTTVARLARARVVLNDEVVLVGRGSEGFRIASAPTDGGLPACASGSRHLDAVFFLKHGPCAELTRLSPGRAFGRMLLQTWAASPFLSEGGREARKESSDFAAEIASGVPCYELAFRPDTSFWPVVESV